MRTAMPDSAIATAADYADAMLVARRAKSLMVLILLIVLLGQITIFFLVKYNVIAVNTPPGDATLVNVQTDAAARAVTASAATQAVTVEKPTMVFQIMNYVSGVTVLMGLALTVLLALILLLLTKIMLVGRLIGVGKLTSAYILTLILLLFLFPWQAILNDALHIPGVLWTWSELLAKINFDKGTDALLPTILGWFRFVVAPLIAVILLIIIQLKSSRGLRMALGEDDVAGDVVVEETSY